ncbi:MAG: DUF4912 domain-containing protein [Candidatus Krumholzibacteria bacterium]|nr:DUF4912 domain-containing protein [Candidatus Krumholzibacteria bacterium]
MKKSELRKMTKKDLLALAKKKRIAVSESMLKADIIDTVFGGLSKSTGKTRTKARTKVKAKAKTKARTKTKVKAKTRAKTKAKVKKKAEVKAETKAKQAPAPKTGWDNGRTIRQKAVAGKYELTAGPITMPPVESMEIPADYGVTRIVAMAKDPAWLFTYWEITAERFMQLEKKFKDDWTKCTMALRIYDRAAKDHFDMNISYEARAWYVGVTPGGRYQVAIGVITPGGKFVKIAESAIIETPRDRMSDRIDEQWVMPDDVYDRIFAASGGYEVVAGGGSAEMRKMLEARLEEQLSSEGVSSFGSGELMPEQKERGFRLRVATELILYGATEPDAKVTIQGKLVKLRRDGTFTARFALPDGTIDIPVTAVSGDRVEERTIDTDVKKKSSEKAPVIR